MPLRKTVTYSTDGPVAPFGRQITIGFQPNEVIVRQISYSGPNVTETGVFAIWSSLTNDHIGSFTVNQYGTTVSPNTHISILSPIPELIELRVDTIQANGTFTPYTGLVGSIVVQLEFVKH